MLTHLQRLFAPPVFEDDEDKSRMAGVLNTLLVTTMLFLLFTAAIIVPFVFVEKLFNSVFVLGLFLALVLARWLVQRGRVRFVSAMLVTGWWIAFTIFLPFTGGMTSIFAVFYVSGTVVAGLLLGTRAALVHTVACSLAGLGMVILESSGHSLPRLFSMPAVVGWVDMTLSLLLTTAVLNLVLRGLNDALALTRRQVEERKQIEGVLRESEERYRQLFEAESDAIFLIENKTSRILEANHAATVLYGYSREELLTKRNTDLSAEPEGTQQVTQETPIIVEQVITIPLRSHRKKDGTVFPVEITGRFFTWQERPVHITAIRDITERVRSEQERAQAEEALRKSEEKFSKAFQSSPLAVLITRLSDGQFIEVNQTFESFSGYRRDEVIGCTSLDLGLVNPQDRENVKRILQEHGSFRNFEARFYTKSGKARIGLFSGEVIEIGGEACTIQVVGDITERVHSEQERAQAEKALQESHRRLEGTLAELKETQEQMLHQERLVAVGQLAAGIAHDFNNILATIVLYTQMSLREAELPPQIRNRLKIIGDQTDRAADLVQQILDFGRRAVLERRPLALDSFLKEVVKLLKRTLPENIQIDMAFEPALRRPPSQSRGIAEEPGEYLINADLTRIQQAVVNLALNARDAMPNGGELYIALSRTAGQEIQCVDCGPVMGEEWVEVTVTDTGIGIAPDVLPHIFEPFFTTRAPLGHGLGLSQVYGIVKQHGGHIDVQTQVRQGTTFKLYWPALAAALPQVEAEASPEAAQGQGETVLVVEDDATMRAVLMDVLDMLGYRVLEAANGREALTVCEQHTDEIALILSDWVMPSMGGLELVHELVARRLATKVLMLTGHPLAKEVKEAVPAHVVGWMLKPPSLKQLAEGVSRAIAENQE